MGGQPPCRGLLPGTTARTELTAVARPLHAVAAEEQHAEGRQRRLCR